MIGREYCAHVVVSGFFIYLYLCIYVFSDLLGAVGYPLKISRTVVSGQSVAAVSRLLYLLTYFIRCSEVEPGFTPVSYLSIHAH